MTTIRPILAIDAATMRCSVAIALPDRVLAAEHADSDRGQAALLIPMVQRVMAAAGIGWSDLAAIAATVGPGSFTGLRVALATAEGLSLAAGLPTIGITTFEALAAAAPGLCLVAIDSRRGDIYAAFDPPHGACGVYRPERLADILPPGDAIITVIGDAAGTAAAAIGPRARSAGPACPDAADIARIAHARLGAPTVLRPLYLRPADAVIPRDGGALRP